MRSKLLYFFIKRLFDIVLSFFGCLFLLPLIVIVKFFYLINGDYSSIIYKQDRIGKFGKTFKLYKFRTMVTNADEMLFDLLKTNKKLGIEYKKYKKMNNDPRITKVGKFLRKYSIDEVPQFINVLKGEMSIIGNRPYLLREKDDMNKYYNDIIKTKPGITGLWQTSGRNNISFKKRLKMECRYSKNCNILLDIQIFFRTFNVLLSDENAN